MKFKAFQEQHLNLFRFWLNQEHIKNVWQEPEDPKELKEKLFTKFPQIGVYPFIIEHQNEEIGYIQYYDAPKVGGGYWEDEKPGTFGIDLMIGIKTYIGKGFGPKIITEFIKYLCAHEKNVKSIIIDPDPKNIFAIRAFEKAGFFAEKEIVTPGGPALLMRMKIL